MTTKINNEHNKLIFSSEREQSQACLNSAEHEKNQGRKVLNVPNKQEQNQTCLDSAEREGLRPKGNVPNLRFPEFQGEWEKCKLGDLCNVLMCKRILASQTNTEEGVPFYKIGTIGNAPDAYISKELFDDYKTKYNYPHKGEVMITCAGTVGKCVIYDGKDAYYQDSNIVWIDNPSQCISNSFLYHLLAIVDWRKLNSTTIIRIYNDDLRNLKLSYPQIEEQQKISRLLSLLDERIATQNKIIDKLQSLIKGIGKQLFMDNQNWRTVKIGELLRIGNGKDYKHLSIGKIPVYGTGGQMLLVNDYLYDGESVCIGRKGTIDTPMFLKGKFWTVDTLFYTYDFKDVLPKFCYYLFLQINWKLYNEGTGVPSLSKSTIENIKVKIPSLEQQQKICSILDCYEHKTNNEEQILELYHSEKQYLLRQMFI